MPPPIFAGLGQPNLDHLQVSVRQPHLETMSELLLGLNFQISLRRPPNERSLFLTGPSGRYLFCLTEKNLYHFLSQTPLNLVYTVNDPPQLVDSLTKWADHLHLDYLTHRDANGLLSFRFPTILSLGFLFRPHHRLPLYTP